jgi:hypothetical protein
MLLFQECLYKSSQSCGGCFRKIHISWLRVLPVVEKEMSIDIVHFPRRHSSSYHHHHVDIRFVFFFHATVVDEAY